MELPALIELVPASPAAPAEAAARGPAAKGRGAACDHQPDFAHLLDDAGRAADALAGSQAMHALVHGVAAPLAALLTGPAEVNVTAAVTGAAVGAVTTAPDVTEATAAELTPAIGVSAVAPEVVGAPADADGVPAEAPAYADELGLADAATSTAPATPDRTTLPGDPAIAVDATVTTEIGSTSTSDDSTAAAVAPAGGGAESGPDLGAVDGGDDVADVPAAEVTAAVTADAALDEPDADAIEMTTTNPAPVTATDDDAADPARSPRSPRTDGPVGPPAHAHASTNARERFELGPRGLRHDDPPSAVVATADRGAPTSLVSSPDPSGPATAPAVATDAIGPSASAAVAPSMTDPAAAVGAPVGPTSVGAAATMSAATPAELPELIGRGAERLRHTGADSWRLHLQLDPPELGPVRLELSTHGDRVHVLLVADSDAARAALDHQRPQLVRILERSGFSLDGFDVSTPDQRRAPDGRPASSTPAPRLGPTVATPSSMTSIETPADSTAVLHL